MESLLGGLFIFIVFFSGIQSGFYHHIAIQVSYLRESISYLIAHTFKTLSILGLLSAGIGFMFMIPYWQRLYKKCLAQLGRLDDETAVIRLFSCNDDWIHSLSGDTTGSYFPAK